MSAEKGEKCGVCATQQYEGAHICRNCHAEREVHKDYSLTGRLKGAATGCGAAFSLLVLAFLILKEFHFKFPSSSNLALICGGVLILGLVWGWEFGSTKNVWIKIRRDRSLEIY